MKELIRDLLPPLLLRSLRGKPSIYWEGDYPSWEAAVARSSGYETAEITRAVAAAPDAKSTYLSDRDQQILACLAVARADRLLDVGGASGHYCRLIQRFRPGCNATVLETPASATALQSRATSSLRFTSTPPRDERFDLIMMSALLQYVPDPFGMLSDLLPLSEFAIINRLPMIDRERITVQRVNQKEYRGSYPMRFFCRHSFESFVEQTHERVMVWQVPQDRLLLDGVPLECEGMLLRRRAK
ncbi:MAG: methyltransferase, TIGR04325 family [Pseudomonadota bacterium]